MSNHLRCHHVHGPAEIIIVEHTVAFDTAPSQCHTKEKGEKNMCRTTRALVVHARPKREFCEQTAFVMRRAFPDAARCHAPITAGEARAPSSVASALDTSTVTVASLPRETRVLSLSML